MYSQTTISKDAILFTCTLYGPATCESRVRIVIKEKDGFYNSATLCNTRRECPYRGSAPIPAITVEPHIEE